jgi:glycosyltransferase involved in cell wall biosynthesis
MITGDPEVLRDGSPAQGALKEQAALAERLMVVVLNSRHRKSQARKVTDNLWIFPTNSWLPFLKIFGALRVIRHEIFYRNKLQADLVVANEPFSSAFVAVMTARRYGKPLNMYIARNIFSFYYTTRSPITLFKSIVARVLIGFANSVSVANESIRAALIRLDPVYADRVTFVPPYIDVQAIQSQTMGEDLHEKYTQFRALLLCVAPLTFEHNVKLAIDVLAQVSKDHQYIGLVIVGSGWGKWPLKYYAQRQGVGGSVMFEAPHYDMTSIYKSAYALLVTSLFDEFESTIEDAAAAGCAIISSPVGVAPKLIVNKENGYLCDPKHMLEYADAVNMLINNDALRTKIRKGIVESAQKFMATDRNAHMLSRKKAWEAAIASAKGY